jgi:hypothetical protein
MQSIVRITGWRRFGQCIASAGEMLARVCALFVAIPLLGLLLQGVRTSIKTATRWGAHVRSSRPHRNINVLGVASDNCAHRRLLRVRHGPENRRFSLRMASSGLRNPTAPAGAACGLPGSPRNAASPSRPKTSGLPGFMATLRTAPRRPLHGRPPGHDPLRPPKSHRSRRRDPHLPRYAGGRRASPSGYP